MHVFRNALSLAAMVLMLATLAACSNDADDDGGDPAPADSLGYYFQGTNGGGVFVVSSELDTLVEAYSDNSGSAPLENISGVYVFRPTVGPFPFSEDAGPLFGLEIREIDFPAGSSIRARFDSTITVGDTLPVSPVDSPFVYVKAMSDGGEMLSTEGATQPASSYITFNDIQTFRLYPNGPLSYELEGYVSAEVQGSGDPQLLEGTFRLRMDMPE